MIKDEDGVIIHYDHGDKASVYDIVNDLLKRVRELEKQIKELTK